MNTREQMTFIFYLAKRLKRSVDVLQKTYDESDNGDVSVTYGSDGLDAYDSREANHRRIKMLREELLKLDKELDNV